MARTRNPDLLTALEAAKQVISQESGSNVSLAALLITEMYDLDYTGIPEMIEKVLAEDLNCGQAVKAINAMKAMYGIT